MYLIREELSDLKRAYGDGRRTRFAREKADSEDEGLLVEDRVLITITQRGYIKRGAKGAAARDEDAIRYLFSARTLDSILFFSNRGKVYQERVYQIPSADRAAKGVLLTGILALDADEHITAAVAVPSANGNRVGARLPHPYLMMVTRQGRAKRVQLSEFTSVQPGGLSAIRLDEGDELGWASLTRGDQDVIIVTEQGQALRFGGNAVRPMGRAAAGINGIKLDAGDCVVDACVIGSETDLLIVTTGGYGKRTPLDEFAVKGRYGKGVRCLGGQRKQTGIVAAARVVHLDDEVAIISTGGVALRAPASDVPQMGRATRGARVMDLKAGDGVSLVAVVCGEE